VPSTTPNSSRPATEICEKLVPVAYSFEPADGGTQVTRWLVLDITIPIVFLPLKGLITRSFDKENIRTMEAVKTYAEAQPRSAPT
jgi:hypothetical protein